MINSTKNTFDVIRFVENYINNNIEKIHKKYLQQKEKGKQKSGFLLLELYGREVVDIGFYSSKKGLNRLVYYNDKIKLGLSNVFNIKKYHNIDDFKKYLTKHITKIKSNIIKNNLLDTFILDLNIENYLKKEHSFFPTSIFKKEELIKITKDIPDIAKKKFKKYDDENNNESLKDDYLYDFENFMHYLGLFFENVNFYYNRHMDYFNSLIEMLDLILKDTDLISYEYYDVVDIEDMIFNDIEYILYHMIIKKDNDILIDKILELNNSILIMFLIRSLLSISYKTQKIKIVNVKHMDKIKEYLKSYNLLIHNKHCYQYILDFLNIDYIELYDDNINWYYTELIKKERKKG